METTRVIPCDAHTSRETFVDPRVKENSITTRIINEIYCWFPLQCRVISGFLDPSDLYWKVNYHWDAMRVWLDYAKNHPSVTEQERVILNRLFSELMANAPTQIGHFELNTIGEPTDRSAKDKIERRCIALQAIKASLATYAERQGFSERPLLRKKGVLRCALNPLSMPARSNHVHGWALDISGEGAASIALALGATVAFQELTHCHCEFETGVRAPYCYGDY